MKIRLYDAGIRAVLNSPGMLAELQGRAEAIAEAAGEGFETRPPETGKKRGRVAVVAATFDAQRREAKDGVLASSADAGRSRRGRSRSW